MLPLLDVFAHHGQCNLVLERIFWQQWAATCHLKDYMSAYVKSGSLWGWTTQSLAHSFVGFRQSLGRWWLADLYGDIVRLKESRWNDTRAGNLSVCIAHQPQMRRICSMAASCWGFHVHSCAMTCAFVAQSRLWDKTNYATSQFLPFSHRSDSFVSMAVSCRVRFVFGCSRHYERGFWWQHVAWRTLVQSLCMNSYTILGR